MELSEQVEILIEIMNKCQKDIEYYERQRIEAETEETNLMHELEGAGVEHRTPPKYKERAVIATKQQRALLKRRKAKDTINLNGPLFELISSPEGIKFRNQLTQVLGKVRNYERHMAERKYNERKVKDEAVAEAMDKTKNFEAMLKGYRQSHKSKY